mgnify:CR=1 FL=1
MARRAPCVVFDDLESARVGAKTAIEMTSAIEATAKKIDRLEITEGYDWTDSGRTLGMFNALKGESDAPLGGAIGGAVRRFKDLVQTFPALRSLGEGGANLGAKIVESRQIQDTFAQKWGERMGSALSGLTPAERQRGFRDWVELKRGGSATISKAWDQLRPILDEIYSTVEAAGGDVEDYIRQYFPRITNYADLDKFGSKPRERFITQLMDEMGFKTRAEAEDYIKKTVMANRKRVAWNLEAERMLPATIDPIYLTNADQAYGAYALKAARRVGELVAFGKGDSAAKEAIDRVYSEFGEGARDFAQGAFDLAVGQKRADIPGWAGELMHLQIAKLSLAGFSNLSQPLNIAMKTSIGTLAKAVFDVAKDPLGAVRRAREIGSITSRLLEDISTGGALLPEEEIARLAGQSTTTGGKILSVKSRAINYLAAPFLWVEKLNRSIASRAGEIWFDSQLAAFKSGDKSAGRELALTLGRSVELLIDPKADRFMVAAARAFAGKRLSDATQFTNSIADMPKWAREHVLGRFLFQFKNFTLNQARFVGGEIERGLREKDPKRVLKVIAMLSTVYPVTGGALALARGAAFGETARSKSVMEALRRDPDSRRYVIAATAGLAFSGGLGIVSDLVSAVATGNSYVMRGLAEPVAFSTVSDLLVAANAGLEGDFTKAARIGLRQAGGIGRFAELRTLGRARD